MGQVLVLPTALMFMFIRVHAMYSIEVRFLLNSVERKHRIWSLCNLLKCEQTGGIYTASSLLSALLNWPNLFFQFPLDFLCNSNSL